MKVVILAGGLGSRISQYTQKIPKPMITIGNIPMLSYIMNNIILI
ncbi:sugar phosphate nucleotidyltransferase [Candidatus Pelagibacter ubique]|nr:sugar phosphate nucleotidyltransferase [Candidatus Pelagibacter ubique]